MTTADTTHPPTERRVIRIEPDERLVVLARTIQAQGPGFDETWKDGADDRGLFEENCLGTALYRHSSVFQNASEAPVWSHLELRYFRSIVPFDAIQRFVFDPQPTEAHLLRAEILLATPSSFVVPRGWRGSSDRPGRTSSIEYIHVRPDCLKAYRDIMRRHIGPAAARLVASDRIGTFRAMETAAVLYHDIRLTVDWNQIHLSEVNVGSFKGFGQEFDAALREISADRGHARVFTDLDRMRSIPRWTFNEPLLERDFALGSSTTAPPLPG